MRILYVVMVAFSCLSVWAEDTNEEQFLDKAMDALESGNYTNALQMLDEHILDKEWDLQFLYRLRGTSHFRLQDFEKARDNYIKALPRSNKGNVERLLGETYEKLGEPKKAISYLDKSIRLAGEGALQNAFARYYKGRALASLGKFSEAKETLLKIKSSESTKDIMGEIQAMLDFCIEKEKLWATLMVEHDDPEGYYVFGDAYARQGNYEDAIKWYIKASEAGYAKAQNELALFYRDGQGADKNIVEAYAWALCAAENGEPEAKDAMEENMTLKQITVAQSRAKELEQ